MEYAELFATLAQNGFYRVERDDRLGDVFPGEDREKGVELWEQWGERVVKIVRIRLPYAPGKAWLHEIPRSDIENALLANEQLLLAEYLPIKLEDTAV